MDRFTGLCAPTTQTDILITTDGTYVYNLAHGRDGSAYGGWTLKIFDPNNGWNLVKEKKFGTSSYYTDGLIADGAYVYAIEWTETDAARITAFDTDGNQIDQWTINQGTTKVINGQYDWVNGKVWLGGLYSPNDLIHRYSHIALAGGKTGTVRIDNNLSPGTHRVNICTSSACQETAITVQ